jgi:hypothetical protein
MSKSSWFELVFVRTFRIGFLASVRIDIEYSSESDPNKCYAAYLFCNELKSFLMGGNHKRAYAGKKSSGTKIAVSCDISLLQKLF